MNVFVVDERLDPTGLGWTRYARSYPGGGLTIPIARGTRIEGLCRQIVSQVPGRIDVLFLCCHSDNMGDAIEVMLGEGLTADTARHFELLRDKWAARAHIEMHSCLVASETEAQCSPNPAYRESWQQDLANLGRWLGGEATVRPTVCRGTSGPSAPGHPIMQALADAAGVTVWAWVDNQEPYRHFMFEGRVHYYQPATPASLP